MKSRSIHEIKHQGLSKLMKVQMLAEYLSKVTHFTKEECKTLIFLHNRLESVGPLDRMRFKEVLHTIFEITDSVMLDLAFNAFDKDGDTFVDDVEFVQGLSIMLRGTTDELIEWCYFIYDMNSDGGVARDELSHCLKGCIIPGYGGVSADDVEESERDIIEIAMRKLDVDRDGQISPSDFKNAVRKDPLLIVSVGPCLPPVRSCATFLALVTEKFRSYTGPSIRMRDTLLKSRHSYPGDSRMSFGFGQSNDFRVSVISPDEVVTGSRNSLMNPEKKEQYVKKAKQYSISTISTSVAAR